MAEIINKVALSKLVVFDLEDYFPKNEIAYLDISGFLYEGFLLKEKDFRESIKNFDWSIYQGKFLGIGCTSDAILPAWAYALVTTHACLAASKVVQCESNNLLKEYYAYFLDKMDYSPYQDVPVILKGCSKKEVPSEAYVMAIQYLQPLAASIMFGEACSAVPLFKKNKNSQNNSYV